MQGPVIVIEKSAEGKVFDVDLTVRNLGDTIGEVFLSDYNYKRNFRLSPGKELNFSYKTKIYESGELEPAQAGYNYLAMPVYAYSNSPKIKVIGEKIVEPVIEEEPGVVEEAEEIAEEAEEKNGFFARLWIVFSSWFGG